MPSPATCRLASADEHIAAQHAVIAKFETALWDGGFNAALLPSHQSAWRRLEALIAARGDDRRHQTVMREFITQGLAIDYFGLDAQRALLDALPDVDLGSTIGDAPRDAFGHKGQAMMCNIAYLKLAQNKASTPSCCSTRSTPISSSR